MRFKGTIAEWNDDRGFGFIEPAEGGERTLWRHMSRKECNTSSPKTPNAMKPWGQPSISSVQRARAAVSDLRAQSARSALSDHAPLALREAWLQK